MLIDYFYANICSKSHWLASFPLPEAVSSSAGSSGVLGFRFLVLLLNYILQGRIRTFFASITSNKTVRTQFSSCSHTTLSFLVNGEKNLRTQHGKVCSAYWDTSDHCCIPRLHNGPHTARCSIARARIVYVVFSRWNCVVLVVKSKKHKELS